MVELTKKQLIRTLEYCPDLEKPTCTDCPIESATSSGLMCSEICKTNALHYLKESEKESEPVQIEMSASEGTTKVDAQEVKHGKWLEENRTLFICSECGYTFEHEGYMHFFNYCPSCGARMDGVKNAE